MNLRNIHNESYVAIYEEGDVKIQGLDGSTNIFIKKVILNIRDWDRIENPDYHMCASNYP